MNFCFFCDAPADILCDGVLGILKDPEGPYMARNLKVFTCDRLLCREHIVEGGMIHFNMGRKKSFWDSRDFCADCVKEGRDFSGGRKEELVSLVDGIAMQRQRLFQAYKHPKIPGDPFLVASNSSQQNGGKH